MWQFVAWRGHEYSLMQSRYTDDRLDPERATRAAARHLRDLYHQFGDWYLAVAAYNCGPGTVQKAVERTGYADFWELRRLRVLPLETTNYVPIILAMTIMSKNASEYGLLEVTPDAALQYDTVEITASTHLALVGDLTDTPVSQLMELNPALLKTSIPEGYALRVPKATARPLIAALQLIPEERRASWRMHKVERGETLAEIGKLYGTTPSRIVAANQLVTESPVAGDRLVIPAVALERNIAAKSMAYGRSSTRASRASARVCR
jgi:membrane-bound lytic murein transglycosylase D